MPNRITRRQFAATVVTGALLIVGIVKRDRVLGWFGPRDWARAGFCGAAAGIAVGTVANDSGSVLLVLGMIYLAVTAGYCWATDGSAEPQQHVEGL